MQLPSASRSLSKTVDLLTIPASQNDYSHSLLLLWKGSRLPFTDRYFEANLNQVTGDLWERYLQLISDPRKTDG
jgi:hypothetical protein